MSVADRPESGAPDAPDRAVSSHPAEHGATSATASYVLAGALLAAPFIALLWISSYARVEPRLFGFPFFYWYQLLWVFLAAAMTYAALRIVGRVERPRAPLTDRSETHPAEPRDGIQR